MTLAVNGFEIFDDMDVTPRMETTMNRSWPALTGFALALSLVAIAPAASRAASPPPEFADCTLETVKDATLSIESYRCPNAKLVADDKLPGFQLESNGSRRLAIRAFRKAAGAPIAAALAAIRKASPGPHTGACVLKPMQDNEKKIIANRFELSPTGTAAKAWDKAQLAGGDAKPPSCLWPCLAVRPSRGWRTWGCARR